jgi:carbon-monoxide dehydrogenase large subunit
MWAIFVVRECSTSVLCVVFIRIPRIVAIDVQEAQARPGLVTVVTGADTAHLDELLTNLFPGSAWAPQPAMAREEVNYAGEPVAAVVAESETAALEAAEFVDVDYEVLPSVGGLDAALLLMSFL